MECEEIIIERERVICIVREISLLLQVESHYQFKLRFGEREGKRTLTIIPHAEQVEITLDVGR